MGVGGQDFDQRRAKRAARSAAPCVARGRCAHRPSGCSSVHRAVRTTGASLTEAIRETVAHRAVGDLRN
eukprot:5054005-Prymnesium_polylepis.3